MAFRDFSFRLPKRSRPGLLPDPFRTARRTKRWRIAKKIILWTGGLGFAAVVAVFAYVAKDLPSPGKINKRVIAESTKIYDRTGEHVLYEVHGEEKRTVIPFGDIPESVRAATITLEDQSFYEHFGVHPRSILRAIVADIRHLSAAQGASTITQQFVKNSLLTNEKTLARKVKELILSLEIEQKFSKDEILGMYLNEIPYGSNAYGIEAAAQTFFGKHARELTLDESALLASLPRAPSRYSPYGSRREELKARQEYALDQMARLGYISADQAREAKSVPVFDKLRPQREKIDAPHFVMYVKEYLEEKYGEQAVEQGGLRVYTTLDWEKQQIAEAAVREGAAKNLRLRANNAALVSLDPKTGHILAMVGSKDYFDQTIDGQVNVTIRDRQPGSSFKPYVYLTAFTKGYLPETILYDVKMNFETEDGKSYEPQNYNGKFNGMVTMAKALGGSLNIPAVQTLYLVGVKDAIAIAKSLGITTLNQPDRYGLSLVLGGGEVKLLDHASAFGTLAAGGVKRPTTAILKVTDQSGAVLEEYRDNGGERVVEEKYVAMLDAVLSDNGNRAWIFGENNPLRFDNRQVAVKTGTTNEFRDAWTVGYTPNLVTGVWVGNNDNASMAEGADGSVVAAPIWRAYMDKALANYAPDKFPTYNPDDYIGEGEGKTTKPLLSGKIEQDKNMKVCEIPGEKDQYCKANKYCPESEVKKRDFINAHSILYYVDRSDPRGPIPEKPSNDPQYKNWEKAVEKYYEDEKGTIIDAPPEDECREDDFSKYKPKISLKTPGSTSSQKVTLSVDVSAPYGVESVSYEVDGDGAGSTGSKPYSVEYEIPAGKNGSTVTIQVRVKDKNGNEAKDEAEMQVSF